MLLKAKIIASPNDTTTIKYGKDVRMHFYRNKLLSYGSNYNGYIYHMVSKRKIFHTRGNINGFTTSLYKGEICYYLNNIKKYSSY